jgi:hypothetical protein
MAVSTFISMRNPLASPTYLALRYARNMTLSPEMSLYRRRTSLRAWEACQARPRLRL